MARIICTVIFSPFWLINIFSSSANVKFWQINTYWSWLENVGPTIDCPNLNHSFLITVHHMPTKGQVIWDKMQMIACNTLTPWKISGVQIQHKVPDTFSQLFRLVSAHQQTWYQVWLWNHPYVHLWKLPWILMERKDFPHHSRTYLLFHFVRHLKALTKITLCLWCENHCCIGIRDIRCHFNDFSGVWPEPLAW